MARDIPATFPLVNQEQRRPPLGTVTRGSEQSDLLEPASPSGLRLGLTGDVLTASLCERTCLPTSRREMRRSKCALSDSQRCFPGRLAAVGRARGWDGRTVTCLETRAFAFLFEKQEYRAMSANLVSLVALGGSDKNRHKEK